MMSVMRLRRSAHVAWASGWRRPPGRVGIMPLVWPAPASSLFTSGLTPWPTGSTPLTAVMRSATVRRPTLPPGAQAVEAEGRTGSWNTDGSFSFDPIGTLTEATPAFQA